MILLFNACNQQVNETEKPVITVSVTPQKYLVEQLAGDLVEVNVMIPPGASPATYEPTFSQLRWLDRSDIYLKMGYLGFEQSWMEKIEEVNPEMEIIDLSTGIALIGEETHEDYSPLHSGEMHHGHRHGIDPHIWMSVHNVKRMGELIHSELIDLLPGDVPKLEDRWDHFGDLLDTLHHSIKMILAGKEDEHFMIYHPALSYFARDYHLHQHALEIEGKAPSPAHMKRMADLGTEKEIRVILIQKEFNRENAEVLASSIGAEIIQIDPLDNDWYAQMVYIARKLAESF